ncbi:MAG: GNAT family N-acetyltransferase [Bacilli bacterium]|nr:GNAT family N-acetyltransferase [Bacilli bacterium]
MRGKELIFIKIEIENKAHTDVLSEITNETSFLGDLSQYNLNQSNQEIAGNNYLIFHNGNTIGYLGLSEAIETRIGKSVSIYYAVRKSCYGHHYGQLILDEVTEILKEQTDIDVIIANVNNKNEYGIKTIERANFKQISELSDDEEKQYHKYI